MVREGRGAVSWLAVVEMAPSLRIQLVGYLSQTDTGLSPVPKCDVRLRSALGQSVLGTNRLDCLCS